MGLGSAFYVHIFIVCPWGKTLNPWPLFKTIRGKPVTELPEGREVSHWERPEPDKLDLVIIMQSALSY